MEQNQHEKKVSKKTMTVEELIKKKQEEIKAINKKKQEELRVLKKRKEEKEKKKVMNLIKKDLKIKNVEEFEELVKYLTNDPHKHEALLNKIRLDPKI